MTQRYRERRRSYVIQVNTGGPQSGCLLRNYRLDGLYRRLRIGPVCQRLRQRSEQLAVSSQVWHGRAATRPGLRFSNTA